MKKDEKQENYIQKIRKIEFFPYYCTLYDLLLLFLWFSEKKNNENQNKVEIIS